LGYETTKFAVEDYLDLVQDVEANMELLPDLKVSSGLIFKRMGNPNLYDELEGTEWKLWIDAQLDRACPFRPQGWPWWNGEDIGDTATTVLLARNDYPGS